MNRKCFMRKGMPAESRMAKQQVLASDASPTLVEGLRHFVGRSKAESYAHGRPESLTRRYVLSGRSEICEQANLRAVEFEAAARGYSRAHGTAEHGGGKGGGGGFGVEECRSNSGSPRFNNTTWDPSDSQMESRYKELVGSIEAALSGSSAPHSTLHGGDMLTGKVGAYERHFYTVPLPCCPSLIVVHIARIHGEVPSMYASTMDARPTPEDRDFEAIDGEISYHHEPEIDERRTSTSTAFHICVEGGQDACEYRIRCTLRRAMAKRRSSNDMETVQTDTSHMPGRIHNRLAMRLEQLRRDPHAANNLKQRCRILQNGKRRQHTKNFDDINHAHLDEYRPEVQESVRNERQSLRRNRFALVLRRHEELELENERRLQWLLGRDDQRKQLKEEEARLQKEEAKRTERRTCWLQKLVVMGFALSLRRKVDAKKSLMNWEIQRERAARTIQLLLMHKLMTIRRRSLYRNVVIFRQGINAYINHTQLAIFVGSRSKVHWFLSQYSLSIDEPDLQMLLRRFMARVRLVQRSFRQRRMIFKARVEACMAHFFAARFIGKETDNKILSRIEEPPRVQPAGNQDVAPAKAKFRKGNNRASRRVTSMRRDSEAAGRRSSRSGVRGGGGTDAPLMTLASQPGVGSQSLGAAQARRTFSSLPAATVAEATAVPCSSSQAAIAEKSSVCGLANNTRRSSSKDSRASSKEKSARVPHAAAGARLSSVDGTPAFVRAYAGEELLPIYVRIHVLRKHVFEMQFSLFDRLEQWRRKVEALQLEEDVHDVLGCTDDGPLSKLGHRPRAVEPARLKDLYSQTYDAYVQGEFRHVYHDYRRVICKMFSAWSRLHRYGPCRVSHVSSGTTTCFAESVIQDLKKDRHNSLLRQQSLATSSPGQVDDKVVKGFCEGIRTHS